MATYTSQYFSTSNPALKYRIVVTETAQNIGNNTTTINVKVQAMLLRSIPNVAINGECIAVIDGETVTQSVATTITYNVWRDILDTNKTITHNDDGTKTIAISARIKSTQVGSTAQGFNVTLTRIPRAAVITGAAFTYDTDNPVINYNNPSGTVVSSLQACISLDGSTAAIAYRDISKTGTSYTFNLTQAERNTLLAATPNSNTLNVVFIIKTVSGSNTFYSSLTKTMTVKDGNPAYTGAGYKDTNSTTLAITGNDQKIIQSNSTISVVFSNISGQKYANLDKITVYFIGSTYTQTLSGNSVNNVTVNIGVNTTDRAQTAVATIYDKRGHTTRVEINIPVIAWSLPAANISLKRKNNYYEETYLTVTAIYASLDSLNTVSIQYQYKEKGAETWTALTTIQDGATETLTLDNQKAYDFKIIVTDRLGSTTYNKTLSTGIPILYVDKLYQALSVNCLPLYRYSFEVWNRIGLQNDLKETISDLASYKVTDPQSSRELRTAQFNIYDHNGYKQFTAGGGLTGGNFVLRDDNNKALVSGGCSSGGGTFRLYNPSSTTNPIINMFATTNNSGRINIKNGSTYTTNIILDGNDGSITCVSLTQTSSRKVKENIKPLGLDEALKILDLVAVTFDFKNKDNGTDKRGFIAEDVADIIPELVTAETEDKAAALDYIEMIPYLQSVIKYQEKILEAQDKKIQELEARLSALESRFDEKP